MAKLTQQGLACSLYDAMEFGYKSAEKGENIQMARSKIAPFIDKMVAACENLPREVLRVDFRKGKHAKVSIVERENAITSR